MALRLLTATSSLFFLRTASSNSLRVKRLDISTRDDLRDVRGAQLGNLFVNGRDGDKPVIFINALEEAGLDLWNDRAERWSLG